MTGQGPASFRKNLQFRKFQAYGFLKNLRFFEPFLMLFFLEKGITFLQIGTLYAVREITINLFEIPSGLVADAWGRRRTLAGSFVFYIISFTTFYFTGNYPWFIVAMLFFSLGEAFRSGVHKAMIFEYLRIKGWEDQKVDYYGLTRSASQTGSAVSSLIAAAIVFWTGRYSAIFILSTLPYLADMFLIISYPRVLDGDTHGFSKEKLVKRFSDTFKDFRISFTRWHVMRKILTLSSFTGYYKSTRDYLQPVIKSAVLVIPLMAGMQEKKRTAIFIGIIYFLIYLMNAYSSSHSGRFFKRLRNYESALLFTLLAGFVMGIAAGILFHFDMKILAIIPFLFIFIFENIRKPIGIAYISENMKQNLMASTLSAESQISSLIASGIAVLLGFAADKFSIGISLISVTVLLLVMVPLIFHKGGRQDEYKK